MRGEEIEHVGSKDGGWHSSLAKKKDAVRRKEAQLLTREDIELSWHARRGLATALIGLGRGKEALAEAVEAMDLAEQVWLWGHLALCVDRAGRLAHHSADVNPLVSLPCVLFLFPGPNSTRKVGDWRFLCPSSVRPLFLLFVCL